MVFGIRILCATYNVQYSSIHVIIYNGPILLQCTRFSAILCNVTNAKDISYGYNIKCILQDKIQNKLLYLTAARVNSLNTWRAFVIHIPDSIYPQYETKKKENIIVCMAKQEESNNLWFMLSSLWNVKYLNTHWFAAEYIQAKNSIQLHG